MLSIDNKSIIYLNCSINLYISIISYLLFISQVNLRVFIKAEGLKEEENILFERDIGPARKITNRLLTGVNLFNSRLGSNLQEVLDSQ